MIQFQRLSFSNQYD